MARLHTLLQLLSLLLVVLIVAAPMILIPGAQLEIDDYRYLSLVQDVQSNPSARAGEALIVRNSLDHLWWVERPFAVQYLRPWVFFSYWLDVTRSTDTVQALFVTNAVIYGCLCLAVWCLMTILFGGGWSTALGVVLFAAFSCHSELLYYVAGRTDSLAALWIVLALCCHISVGLRWLAPVLYLFALSTKELALFTPLFCLLVDWAKNPAPGILHRLRSDYRIYLWYAAVLTVFLGLRHVLLPQHESVLQLAPPYAPADTLTEWGEHLYVQVRAFIESVLWGSVPSNYQSSDGFRLASGWWIGGALVFLIGIRAVWRVRQAQALIWIAFLSYAPLTIVYFSERYYLIPTIAVCGTVIVLLKAAEERKVPRLVSRALLLVWIAHQALVCSGKNLIYTHPTPPYQKEPYVLSRFLDSRRDELLGTKRFVVVSVPGHWVVHLFFEPFLRVYLKDPDVRVLLLTLWPNEKGAAFRVHSEFLRRGVVRVSSEAGVMSSADALAPTVSFMEGQRYTNVRTAIHARVVSGDTTTLRSVEFALPEEFQDAPLLQFLPGGSPESSSDDQLYHGSVRIISPSP